MDFVGEFLVDYSNIAQGTEGTGQLYFTVPSYEDNNDDPPLHAVSQFLTDQANSQLTLKVGGETATATVTWIWAQKNFGGLDTIAISTRDGNGTIGGITQSHSIRLQLNQPTPYLASPDIPMLKAIWSGFENSFLTLALPSTPSENDGVGAFGNLSFDAFQCSQPRNSQ